MPEEYSATIDQLLGEIASAQARASMLEAQVAAMDDDIPEWPIIGGDAVGETEDYAFKIKATYDEDTDKFVGKVLGGSAMALGGNVTLFDDLDFDDAEEGDYVYLVYENVDSSFNEVGSWGATIEIGDDTAIGGYNAPQNLVFVIGQISSTYIKNVRQDHKGAIVMPAISNVVDIQTQLP